MKEKTEKVLAIAAIIAIIVVAIFAGYLDHIEDKKMSEEHNKLKSIVDEVHPLIEDCKRLGDRPISISGKCLLWDVSGGNKLYYPHSELSDRVPDELKATLSDKMITVFLATDAGTIQVRDHHYRHYVDICVVKLPDKKALGTYTVLGEEFYSTEKVASWITQQDALDRQRMVADWIKGLPME